MSVVVAILTCFLCGCTVISGGESSYIYEYDTEIVDSVVNQIEQDLAQREEAGEITVSREEYTYVVGQDEDIIKNEAGKQNAVIDNSVNPHKAEVIPPADVNTTGDKPLYYNHLTATQQQIYRYMKTAAEQMQVGLFSVGAVASGENRFTDIAIAFRALAADNPQIFWLPGSYIMSPDGSAVAFSYGEKGIDYTLTAQQKRTAQVQLSTTVNNLVAQANTLNSRYEKELFFHDWLCQNVKYSDDGTENVFTAYGALINGVAVCEGYSRAMQLLCDGAGIPCTVVYGSSRNVGHMWNIINPGDGWYHLDVTWDDDEKYNYTRHAYFNLTDAQILTDHNIFDVVTEGKYYIGSDNFNLYKYDCTAQHYNYFIKNKLVFTDDLKANAKLVIDAAKKGKNNLEVYYIGEEHKLFLELVNVEIYATGSKVWINNYSYSGSSLVLWW